MTDPAQAANEYLKNKIKTASKEQLVLMLYDGAIALAKQAKVHLVGKQWDVAHTTLIRAQNILLELIYALDREKGGAVAENLYSLYNYCYTRLVEANVHHAPEKIDECLSIMNTLREAWATAMEEAKKCKS